MSARCHKCGGPVLPSRKMTATERAWCRRLEDVLKDAPPSIGILTIGGAVLTVYDRPAARLYGIEHLEDGGCDGHGLTLGIIDGAVDIEAVSG